jgi:hypothetical protein
LLPHGCQSPYHPAQRVKAALSDCPFVSPFAFLSIHMGINFPDEVSHNFAVVWFSPSPLQPAFTPEGICPYNASSLSIGTHCICSTQHTNSPSSKLMTLSFCRNIGRFTHLLLLIRFAGKGLRPYFKTNSSFQLHQMMLTG